MTKYRKIERIVYNRENVQDKVGPPTKKVLDQFIQEYFPKAKPGEEKNRMRQIQYNDPFNAFSWAAVSHAALGINTPDQVMNINLYNTDPTSLLVSMEAGKIHMAKCTYAELKAHNLSAKSSAGVASQQKRGVQIIPTTNAEGSTLSTTIHIHERDHKGEPAWECIDKSKKPFEMLWVCISKPNFDHVEFHEELYKRTIMPYAILARDQHDRQQAIDLREHQLFADEDAASDAASDATASSHHHSQNISSQYSGSSSGGYQSGPPPIPMSRKNSRIVMTMDGDISGIDAVFKTLNESYKDENVHWLKSPAACSMTMQAMDLARTYMLFKLFLKKGTFNTKEIRAQDMPEWLRRLEPWLKHNIKGTGYTA